LARVARLASLAGIAAHEGYKRRPDRYGGKPAIVVEIEPVNATGPREPARAGAEVPGICA